MRKDKKTACHNGNSRKRQKEEVSDAERRGREQTRAEYGGKECSVLNSTQSENVLEIISLIQKNSFQKRTMQC